jgi:hypothetical protein
MKNIALVADVYGAWNPGDVAFIAELRWTGNDGSSLELVTFAQPRARTGTGWPNRSAPWYKVVLNFGNVGGFSLREFGPGPRQVMGFSIERVGERGLERLNYRVEDYENGAIEFYSETAEIVSVERVLHEYP